MKTVYIVFESSWRGKLVSAVFDSEVDSAYEYYMQEWEVK